MAKALTRRERATAIPPQVGVLAQFEPSSCGPSSPSDGSASTSKFAQEMRILFVRILVILAAVFVAGRSIADQPLEHAAAPKEVLQITESISKLRHPAPWKGYEGRLGLTNLKGNL